MSKEIGPKEKMLREQREARFNNKPKPSHAELRKNIAKIKPVIRKGGGGRGR